MREMFYRLETLPGMVSWRDRVVGGSISDVVIRCGCVEFYLL